MQLSIAPPGILQWRAELRHRRQRENAELGLAVQQFFKKRMTKFVPKAKAMVRKKLKADVAAGWIDSLFIKSPRSG